MFGSGGKVAKMTERNACSASLEAGWRRMNWTSRACAKLYQAGLALRSGASVGRAGKRICDRRAGMRTTHKDTMRLIALCHAS